MIPARVTGHAVSSHCHPSLRGCRLLVCQPLDGAGAPAGEPMIAIDVLGTCLHSKVFDSTDGMGARQRVGDPKSPLRNFVQGIVDG